MVYDSILVDSDRRQPHALMSTEAVSTLDAKLRTLTTQPGVYLMKDAEGVIIYVGKAKSLRSRVRSYFQGGAQHGIKTREMVRRVTDFDTIVVRSEAEALILENNLIKENRPRFNINLRDDKTYPYIKVTQEPVPRIFVTRRLQPLQIDGPIDRVYHMASAVGVRLIMEQPVKTIPRASASSQRPKLQVDRGPMRRGGQTSPHSRSSPPLRRSRRSRSLRTPCGWSCRSRPGARRGPPRWTI